VSGRVGAVAIGRNEGVRLVRCLESLQGFDRVVYVDSGSTDGSRERARSLGAEVVELDLAIPFTAARARNAGFAALAREPGLELVQFVDGDCELVPGWLEPARDHLRAHPEVAVVCGRRRERAPEATPYNLLTELEWDTPVGEVEACGGDALVRAASFAEVGGYDPALIAGEEPELCLRLRRRGGRIVRLDREMTLHDAALERFGQWWRRQVRAGHAYAESAWLHGRGPERFRVRPLLSILFWGAALPGLALLVGLRWPPALLLLLAAYGALAARVYTDQRRRRARAHRAAALYAGAVVLGKLAGAEGCARFAWNRLLRRRSGLIEYKGPT
jgi:GT2 family glycosyltransferase